MSPLFLRLDTLIHLKYAIAVKDVSASGFFANNSKEGFLHFFMPAIVGVDFEFEYV